MRAVDDVLRQLLDMDPYPVGASPPGRPTRFVRSIADAFVARGGSARVMPDKDAPVALAHGPGSRRSPRRRVQSGHPDQLTVPCAAPPIAGARNPVATHTRPDAQM